MDISNLPLWWATAFTVVLFCGITLGVWLLSRKEVFSDAPDQASWRDLRVWASALVVVQLCIYMVFS